MLKFRLFHVGQVHKQFVQTLGEAGLMGLLLLLAYLLSLFQAALRHLVASRRISAQSGTETPGLHGCGAG